MSASHRAAAGLLLACASFSPAGAQQLIQAFTLENVTAALTALGAASVQSGNVTGADGQVTPVVQFQTNGLNHNAALEVCKPEFKGCLGLSIVTIWNGVPNPDTTAINNFNLAASFGKAVSLGDAVGLQRYAISDGGITPKNLQENIANHVGLAVQFAEYYRNNSGANTVSLKA
jgi:hypothetical protein